MSRRTAPPGAIPIRHARTAELHLPGADRRRRGQCRHHRQPGGDHRHGGAGGGTAITAIATDTGTQLSDFITSDTTLMVSGTNGALARGEKIQVSSDGGATWHDCDADTAPAGAMTIPADARHELHLSGADGRCAPAMSAPPPARRSPSTRRRRRRRLAITAIATDTGTSSSDFITSDTTLTVSGTQRRARRRREDAGQQRRRRHLGRCDAGPAPAGAMTIPPTARPSFTYRRGSSTPPAISAPPTSQAITIDTAAPAATWRSPRLPPTPAPASDFITSDTTLMVSGTNGALAPARRCRSAATAAHLGRCHADTAPPGAMTDTGTPHGTSFTYQARMVDGAGNVGSTASQAVTIDTAAPTATVAITAIADRHRRRHRRDFITSDTVLTVSGTKAALAAARRSRSAATAALPGGLLRRTAARAGATPTPANARHQFTYQARMVDAAGNVGSTDSQAVTIDTAAPTATVRSRRLPTTPAPVATSSPATPSLTVSGTNGALARRREGAGQQRRRRHLGGCDAGHRHELELCRSGHARHELHLPGADGRRGGQCRRHRQPGGDHRYGGADGDGRRSRRLPTTPAAAPSDFITSDTVLTVSGTNGALGCRREGAGQQRRRRHLGRCDAAPARTWSYADPATHATSFTYQARVVDAAGNVGQHRQPGGHHRHGGADGDGRHHRDCRRHRRRHRATSSPATPR